MNTTTIQLDRDYCDHCGHVGQIVAVINDSDHEEILCGDCAWNVGEI